jgi:ABC-2 type transport system permease protein
MTMEPRPAAGTPPPGGAAWSQLPTTASSATGSIFDLGYQGYDGPRLGRRHAVYALFVYSLRSAFGIGRSGRAKIVPIGLAILATLPAVISIAVRAFAAQAGAGEAVERIDPIRYDSYYGYISTIVMLFVAAQAPELLGRDQRHHVLSLYFSRALLRVDYVVAKGAALAAAILVVILIPQAVIFVGLVIANADLVAALGDNIGSIPPVLAVAATIAVLLGSIGLAISAFTPRRAYATAAIMAIFTVPGVVAQIVIRETTGGLTRYIVLAAPGSVIDGVNAFLFGTKPGAREVVQADLAGWLYLAVAAAVAVALIGILVRRYQRIEA